VVNGFVVPVEETDDFSSALKRKLFYEIAGSGPDFQAPTLHLAAGPR
jgi:hypothetical protein